MNESHDLPTDEVPVKDSGLVRAVTGVVLPLGILVVCLACAGVMISMRTPPPREAPEAALVKVKVQPLVVKTQPASIAASGTVTGAQQVRLSPEVSGRVTRISEHMLPGGRFSKGEVLVQLDTRNYTASVAVQKQLLAKAELDLALERNRKEVAGEEWRLLGDKSRDDSSLAQRVPHLQVAIASVEAARAQLEQAEANLGRTRIVAPFNGVVVEESVDVGQVLQPGAAVGTLIGTDALWVQIALPVEKLDGLSFGAEGSEVVVNQRLGAGKSVVREGFVKQLMGQLDPQTRTAQVLVEIPDPYAADGLPLMPGAYVDVNIEGRTMTDTWEVPRASLVDGEYVWVIDQESALRKRRVFVGWRNAESVIVTAGFEPSDQLVTSPLALPIEGQTVVVTGEG